MVYMWDDTKHKNSIRCSSLGPEVRIVRTAFLVRRATKDKAHHAAVVNGWLFLMYLLLLFLESVHFGSIVLLMIRSVSNLSLMSIVHQHT